MLDEEIRKLREKLDESIITGKKYNEIYSLSVKLDKLIAKHYIKKEEKENKKKNSIK